MGRTRGAKSGPHANKTGPKPAKEKLAIQKEHEAEKNRSQAMFNSFLNKRSTIPNRPNQQATPTDAEKQNQNHLSNTSLNVDVNPIPLDVNSTQDITIEDDLSTADSKVFSFF